MNPDQKRIILSEAARAAGQQASEEQEATPRIAWHRPRLERLRVSLDTALTGGTGSDGVKDTLFN